MAAFLEDSIYTDNPKTLGDWVKNFRLKKIKMKRKFRHGGNLRVCAILTTALNNAEEELRRKQQERFNRWAEVQTKFGYYNSNKNDDSFYTKNNLCSSYSSCASEVRNLYYNSRELTEPEDDSLNQQRQDISDLWKSELKGLDQFMKNMSRSSCSV